MTEEFEQLLDRENNGSLKWDYDYIQSRFEICGSTEYYPLFIADMDYRMDAQVFNSMMATMEKPDFGYFRIGDRFYESIMRWHKRINQVELKKEWLVPSLGTVTSLVIASRLFGTGKNFLMMTPIYGHLKACSNWGNLLTLPLLLKNGRYDLNRESFVELAASGAFEILIFCNPHNPSGRMWTFDELNWIVDVCKDNNILILSDEIHSDLNLTQNKFISMIEFQEEYDRIFVSTSANKTFNLSGLNASYVICANEAMREQYEAFLSSYHLGANRYGLMMHQLSYDFGYERRARLIENIKGNIDLVKSVLLDTDVEVMEPEFGYLVWVKLPGITDVDAYVLDLAKQTRVLLETGSRFIDHYERYLRINVATSKEMLRKALALFVQHYNSYQEEES